MRADAKKQQRQQVHGDIKAQISQVEHVRHPGKSKVAGNVDKILQRDQPTCHDDPRAGQHGAEKAEDDPDHRADGRDAAEAVGHIPFRHIRRAESAAGKVAPGVDQIGDIMREVVRRLDKRGTLRFDDGRQAEGRACEGEVVEKHLERIKQELPGGAVVDHVPVVDRLDHHAEARPLRIDERDQGRKQVLAADRPPGAQLRDELKDVHGGQQGDHGPENRVLFQQTPVLFPQRVAQDEIDHDHQRFADKSIPPPGEQRGQHVDAVYRERQLHLLPVGQRREEHRERRREEHRQAAEQGGHVFVLRLREGAEIAVSVNVKDRVGQHVEKREGADEQHGHADLPDDRDRRAPPDGAPSLFLQGVFAPQEQRRREVVRGANAQKRQRDRKKRRIQIRQVVCLQIIQQMMIVAEVAHKRHVHAPEQEQVERPGEHQKRKIPADVDAGVPDRGDVQRDVRRKQGLHGRLHITAPEQKKQKRNDHQDARRAEQHGVPQAVFYTQVFRSHGQTSDRRRIAAAEPRAVPALSSRAVRRGGKKQFGLARGRTAGRNRPCRQARPAYYITVSRICQKFPGSFTAVSSFPPPQGPATRTRS